MRMFAAIGFGVTLLTLGAATPSLANPPELEYKPGNQGPGVAHQGGPRQPNGGGQRINGGGQPFNGGGREGRRLDGTRGQEGRQFGGDQPYRRRGGYGAAVGAGVAGLAAGALIGGAIANQQSRYGYGDAYGGYGDPGPGYIDPGATYADEAPVGDDSSAYCASRYRSYDPESGTFLGNDGLRHPCP